MANEEPQLVAVGWDVRGWRSRQQATAVARLAAGGGLEWLGVSAPFGFSEGAVPGFLELVAPAVGEDAGRRLLACRRLVVAIDAPLSFPAGLAALLNGTAHDCRVPAREIDNRLAYRECERRVYRQFAKKPLSPTFDKLGNNATLAMCVARTLGEDGLVTVPQQGPEDRRAVIEVYPALAKRGAVKGDVAIAPVRRLLPEGVRPGTDQYDAALCAIMGLLFLGGGSRLDLPGLIAFDPALAPEEGWIYALPPAYVAAHREMS